MATYDKKINRKTDWGGDSSTLGLPVAGNRVQEFIKDELNGKIGTFYKPKGGNTVYGFSTEEDKQKYINTGDESLIISSFETDSNYKVEINTETLVYSRSVIYGTTGNTVEFEFKIVDNGGMPSDSRASITYSFLAAGVTKKYTTEVQVNAGGWTHIESDVIDKYLRNGENTITISIQGLQSKAETQFFLTYNLFDLKFDTHFDYTTVKRDRSIVVPYTIECSETKYLEFFIDGNSVGNPVVIEDVRRDSDETINISSLSVGQHSLQARAYVKAKDGTKFYSDTHYYTFAVYGETSNPSFLMNITLDNTQDVVEAGNDLRIHTDQFDQVSFDWTLYDYYNRRLTVVFEYEGKILSSSVSDSSSEVSTFSFRTLNNGDDRLLRIYSYDDNDELIFEEKIYFDVKETGTGIKEATDGMLLKLQSIGRRNDDSDKDVWSCIGSDGNTYEADFHNFSWSSQQGWNAETESLVVSNGAYVDFNIKPMISDWAENGGTIEMDIETFDIEDEDAVICECKSNIGDTSSAFFRITATKAEFSTADGISINTRYKDNDRLKIAFIGNRKGNHEDGNLIYIVVNGVLERAALYTDTDNIYSTASLSIGDKTGKCKLRLRSIRVYRRALSVDEEFNNFVVDSDDVQTIYEKNNVLKPGTTEIGFDEIANKLPVMIFTGDMHELVTNGQQDKAWRPFDVEYINRQEPERNFVSFNCQLKLQGTSSLGYPRKNFKLKTKDKYFTETYYETSNYEIDMTSIVGNRMLKDKRTGTNIDFGVLKDRCFTFDYNGNVLSKGKYRFRANSHKATKWTLKADFMESSCSHNVGAGRSWNDIFENTKLSLGVDAGYVNQTYKDSALVNRNAYDTYTSENGTKYRVPMYTDEIMAQKDYVCRTDAQKVCIAEGADDIRTAIDGFPMVCFYRTSHQENNLVFMGQYNFINDKGSYEVFGFEDIEDPNDESGSDDETMIYDASQVECWEGLKNTNPISLFKTIEDWDGENGWRSTYESRYPDPDDAGDPTKRQVDATALFELSKWLLSTRHEDDVTYNGNIEINAGFAKRINTYQYGYTESTISGYTYLDGDASSITVEDNAENRQKKFEVEKWEHFDVWKLAGYYIYLMRYGAVDQFVKNTMLFTDGNGRYDPRTDKKYRKWFFLNYDNDCLFGLRNNGELAFHWDLDRQTKDGAADIIVDENVPEEEGNANIYAMMGHDSTLWNNLEADNEFMRMVRDLDDSMGNYGLNYENMVKEFDTNQTEQWCERIYNANERYKYIQAAKGIGDMEGEPVDNLWMLQGTRRSHRHWWIANHFNLLDAKWLSGGYKNTYVQIKLTCPIGVGVNTVAGADYYYAWGQQKSIYESNIEKKEGESLRFEFATPQSQGDPVYIYAVNKMSEMDFSELALYMFDGSFYFNIGNKDVANTLKKLVIGNPSVTNNANGIVTSTWSQLPNLEYLDITNYKGIKIVPLSSFKNLHVLKAKGSSIAEFSPADGSVFTKVELPQTISTLNMNNLKFNSFANDFDYTPNTTLRNLKLSSNDGIDVTYFTNLIKPWLTAINNSTFDTEIYSDPNTKINISNINWSFRNLDEIRIFKKFKENAYSSENFKLSGTINLVDCGNLTMENIEEIKSIFGENCFNEKIASLYVITPESVFLTYETDTIVAGKTLVVGREIYPDENALDGIDHTIVYYIVKETNISPVDNPDVIYDSMTGKKFLPITDLDEVRSGLTFTNLTDGDGKEICTLDTQEYLLHNDNEFYLLVKMKLAGSVDKISFSKFYIKDPTYAATATIEGEKSLYRNNTYLYNLILKDSNGKTPIGTIGINWTIGGEGAEYVAYSAFTQTNNNSTLEIRLGNNQPLISSRLTISAQTDNYQLSDLSSTYNVLCLNEDVIMTRESNSVAMDICYNNGWAQDEDAMTKAEAQSVSSIGTAFSNVTTPFSFNELKYFNGLTELEDSAFRSSKITEVTLPETILEFGNGVFENCNSLTKISCYDGVLTKENTLPSITTIPENCFKNCTALNKLIMPDSVVKVENYSFGNTGFRKALLKGSELENGVLILSSNLVTMMGSTFETGNWTKQTTSNKLTVFSIPKKMGVVGDTEKVLWGREYVEYITEPGGNYIADDGVLYSANKQLLLKYPAKKNDLQSFIINQNVNTINSYVFFGTQYLNEIITPIAINPEGLGESVFDSCSAVRIDLRNSHSITSIPRYAFMDCLLLEEVLLPNENTITTFGHQSFYNCPSLTGITIPNGVTTFEIPYNNANNYIFYNCGFTELSIPDSVVEIGNGFLRNCRYVTDVRLPRNVRLDNRGSTFPFISDCRSLERLTLPVFSYDGPVTYNVYDENDSLVEGSPFATIEEAESVLPENGRIEEVDGENIVFQKSITIMTINGSENFNEFIMNEDDNGKTAFIYDGSLYYVNYNYSGETLTEITNSLALVPNGKYSVDIYSDITAIEAYCFRGCTRLTEINIPDSVESIGQNTFDECTGIKELVIPSKISMIPQSSIRGCTSLEKLYLMGQFNGPTDEWPEGDNYGNELGAFSLNRCPELKTIYFLSDTAPGLYILNTGNPTYGPFGYGNDSYTGRNHRSEGINKIYVPYNSNGYSEWNDTTSPVWGMITDTTKCGYTIENLPLSGTIHVEIFDTEGERIEQEHVFATSESGDFTYSNETAIGQYDDASGKYAFVLNSNVYHNETIHIYLDSMLTNEIGEIQAKLFVYDYSINGEIEFGSGAKSRSRNVILGDGVAEGDESMIEISKDKYDAILNKLTYLSEIIKIK